MRHIALLVLALTMTSCYTYQIPVATDYRVDATTQRIIYDNGYYRNFWWEPGFGYQFGGFDRWYGNNFYQPLWVPPVVNRPLNRVNTRPNNRPAPSYNRGRTATTYRNGSRSSGTRSSGRSSGGRTARTTRN